MALFSQAVSPANLTAWQENDLAQQMTAISGQKCLESFAKFNQTTLWQKMYVASLLGMKDWYSTKCNLTWKLRGTKSCRLYFQLVPLVRPIDGTGFGLLLKTPTANLMEGCKPAGTSQSTRTLAQQAQWTPHLLPTPMASDFRGGCIRKTEQLQYGTNLSNYLAGKTQHTPGKTFQLNPPFVEEMMGFPTGWTDLNL